MRDFSYHRATSVDDALGALAAPGAMLLAGGTTVLDLAKCGVNEPDLVVDITHIAGHSAVDVGDDELRIGALARMSDVADRSAVRRQYPAIAESLSLAASAQLRNMATIGGNLMQRTRCSYFRDPQTFACCNKREPGSGCAAIGGITRNHAVLGGSAACIATYPGDLAVALVAFDAIVDLGARSLSADAFFLAPGDTPERETALKPGEMIVGIRVPASASARNSTYLKIRDRQSYEFAAASAAVGLELEADGRTVKDVRVALGGVATRPWRARGVEQALVGRVLEDGLIERASRLSMEGAVAQGDNHHKIELAPRVVARAIKDLASKVGGLA